MQRSGLRQDGGAKTSGAFLSVRCCSSCGWDAAMRLSRWCGCGCWWAMFIGGRSSREEEAVKIEGSRRAAAASVGRGKVVVVVVVGGW